MAVPKRGSGPLQERFPSDSVCRRLLAVTSPRRNSIGFLAPIPVVLVGLLLSSCGDPTKEASKSAPHPTPATGDLAPLPKAGINDATADLILEADSLARSGHLPEAVEKLAKAAAADKEDEELTFNLAYYESRIGRTNDAIAHYRDVLKISPLYTEAHNNLGNLYLKLNDLTNAAIGFREAIRLNPKHPSAHNNLGIVLAREGSLPEAIQQFEEATRIKPDYAEAWLNLGNALTGQGRLNEAINPFEIALKINPGMPQAIQGLRRIQARLGGQP